MDFVTFTAVSIHTCADVAIKFGVGYCSGFGSGSTVLGRLLKAPNSNECIQSQSQSSLKEVIMC